MSICANIINSNEITANINKVCAEILKKEGSESGIYQNIKN